MSEETGPLDAVETLEQALEESGDVVVRAYITRLGGSAPRVSIGTSLPVRRDLPLLDQLVAHVETYSTEGGGQFEVKLKAGKTHVGSARVQIELPEGSSEVPGSVPGGSSRFPRGSSRFPRGSSEVPGGPLPDDEISSRAANPSAAAHVGDDSIDAFLAQALKFKKLKEVLLDDDGPEDDDDDEEEDDDGEGDDEEGEKTGDEKAVESVVKGTAEFLVSESGKALLGRLANALVERLELGTETLRESKKLLELQAAKLSGTTTSAPSAPTQEAKAENEAPRVLRIVIPGAEEQAS